MRVFIELGKDSANTNAPGEIEVVQVSGDVIELVLTDPDRVVRLRASELFAVLRVFRGEA